MFCVDCGTEVCEEAVSLAVDMLGVFRGQCLVCIEADLEDGVVVRRINA